MDIDEKMIKAFSNRVKKEYEEFVYEGINVSKIRSMVGGYSSIDLAPNIQAVSYTHLTLPTTERV